MSNGQKYRPILPQQGQHLKHNTGNATTINNLSPDCSIAVPVIGPVREPVVYGGSKKRKRIATQIACNACRHKKIRCGGQRPSCSSCTVKGLQCVYVDDGTFSPSDTRKILDLLRSQPSNEAHSILNQIRSSQDPASLLYVIKAREPRRLLSSEACVYLNGVARHTVGLADESTLGMELLAGSPVSYPPPPSLSMFTAQMNDLLWPFSCNEPETRPALGPSETVSSKELDKDEPLSEQKAQPTTKSTSTLELCDERLLQLDISCWTRVPIESRRAACLISLYLETDHPLIGSFDPDAFVGDLVQCRKVHCSSFLVNTLLFLGCQMYSSLDAEMNTLVQPFCEEARRIWDEETPADNLVTLAALQLLSQAFLGHGKDHYLLIFRNEACRMSQRMSLLGVDASASSTALESMPEDERSASSLTSLFYQQPGFDYPEQPPILPLPRPALKTGYMGETLPALCKFWRILHGVALSYHRGTNSKPETPSQRVTLAYAEVKFRELLSWAEKIPEELVPHDDSPHHVVVLHIWLHAAILDIFRPFLCSPQAKQYRFFTFYSFDNTPDAAFQASVKQLERLILLYRSQYPPSRYSILWHTSLIYVANAVLQDRDGDAERRHHLLLCIYGYVHLRKSYRVAEASGRALLALTMRHGGLSPEEARNVLNDMKHEQITKTSTDIRATFMADLTLSMTDPREASVERLSQQFEGLALLREFTNLDTDL